MITHTIERWDGKEAARRIELHVGRDLQFIRINGTIVGGLVGVLIHAVSVAVADAGDDCAPWPNPFDVPIRDESIRLGQFLKLANLIESGGEAKPVLQDGIVQVNGEVETRRGRQLVRGDVVSWGRSRPGSRDGDVPDNLALVAGSADAEQVDHEDQRLARLDRAAGAAVAVPEVRRDHELAAAADLHALRRPGPSRR